MGGSRLALAIRWQDAPCAWGKADLWSWGLRTMSIRWVGCNREVLLLQEAKPEKAFRRVGCAAGRTHKFLKCTRYV